jgi:hypothetical protein
MSDTHCLRYSYDVSASCLAYLCADRLVRRLSSMGRATGEPAVTSPTSGTLLPIVEVELQCLATALWSLDHHGLIKISDGPPPGSKSKPPYRKRRKGETSWLFFERLLEDSELPGLEGLLLSEFPDGPIGIGELLSSDTFDLRPIDALLVPIQREAADANVAVLSEQGRPTPRSLSWSIHARYEVREGSRRSVGTQFRVAEEIGLFGGNRPRMFKEVRARCGQALWSLRAHSSGGIV